MLREAAIEHYVPNFIVYSVKIFKNAYKLFGLHFSVNIAIVTLKSEI
jgi:hypothetical protein